MAASQRSSDDRAAAQRVPGMQDYAYARPFWSPVAVVSRGPVLLSRTILSWLSGLGLTRSSSRVSKSKTISGPGFAVGRILAEGASRVAAFVLVGFGAKVTSGS